MDTLRDLFGRGWMPVLLVGAVLAAGCGRPEPEPLDPATRALLAEAEQALEAQAYDRALALADSAARRAPGAVEPAFLQGLVHSRLLRWEEAAAAYRRVIARDPGFPGVWNNLGNNAVWQGSYREAVGYYRAELARAPAATPWASMGRVYRELGLVDSAAYAYEQALALDSSYIPAYISYARLMEDEGEYERALAITGQAARRVPGSVEVHYMLGSLLAKLGREEEAVPHLETVVRASPWHTESHYKLGQVLQRLGRDEEARVLLAEAEKLWKRQADVSSYQKGVAMSPDNPYAHAALATAFRVAGRYDEAVRTYRIALSLDPTNLEFKNNLASLYFLQKDTLAAIQTYHEILKRDPEMAEVWVNLGVLYALSGEKEPARLAWRNALALRPDDPKVRAYLARLDAGS